MNKQVLVNFIGIVLLLLTFGAARVLSQTTEFSYQGFLNDNSASANGNFDFEFRLYDAATGGTLVGSAPRFNVTVTNGVFSVVLDFGSFPAANRFLEIGVRPAGGGAFTTLAPRSKVLAVPSATTANNAQNAVQLNGTPANQFVQTIDPRLSDARNPLSGSPSYVQNRTTQQTATNFNIVGNGTVNGTLSGTIVNATTQYNLGTNRVLAKFGVNNLYLGTLAGAGNGGIQNTMLGDSAGRDNTGDENVFVGFIAGQPSTTGDRNTFVGSRSGLANTVGSDNSFLGYNSDAGSNNLVNATAIGANAFVEQSNAIVLGSINGINGATTDTNVGIGVTTPARRLDVNGNVRVGSTTGTVGCVEDRDGTVIAGTCASDLRFKKNITPFGSVLSNFSKLRPVNYFWRADEFSDQHFGTKQSFGLIAQEVEAAFPELVSTDEQGFKAINYSKLPLYTIQAVNELKAENDWLKQNLQRQQTEIDELKKAFGAIRENILKPKPSTKVKSVRRSRTNN